MRRWLVRLAVVLLAVEVLYLVSANVLLATDVIPGGVGRATHQVKMKWDRAWTLWPGHFSVRGFSMQLDDDNMVQMDLSVERSTVDLALPALLHRMVKLENAHAWGVSYRMTTKVTEKEARESPERVAAFPVVPGYAFPPLRPAKPPPKATPEQIAQLWGVELTDVDSELKEIWIDEYRYLGGARVKGSFAFAPLKSLQVGPARLSFEGGSLSAGTHVIFSTFEAKVGATIAKVGIETGDPMPILRALTASIHTRTRLEGLDVAALYLDGVRLRGSGPLEVDLETVKGRLTSDSRLKLKLEHLDGRALDMKMLGATVVNAAVTPGGKIALRAELTGNFTTPPLDGEALTFALTGAGADVLLSTTDFAAPVAFERLSARVAEARAVEVGPITHPAAKYVPVIAPAVLGDGPLTASASCLMTPETFVVRLHDSKLGAARLKGAVKRSAAGWNGAAAGKFDKLQLGLKLDRTKFGYQPFVGQEWLDGELKRSEIAQEHEPAPVPGAER